jgi:hypothetical protein
VQRGERTFSFIYVNVANKTKTQRNDRDAYLGYNATNKDNYPQNTKEKMLPKYDSQSETRIDSCA